MTVAATSVFDKLRNLPLALSEALLREGTARLSALLPQNRPASPLPACWSAWRVFALDGKAIKHVKRLLKPLRSLQAGILGGRASVLVELHSGLATGMVGHEDGEAGEGALSTALLQQIPSVEAPCLVVLDRLYCNLSFPRSVLTSGSHFLIRYNTSTSFHADAQRPAKTASEGAGNAICDEWGWLGPVADPQRLRVRRITKTGPDGTVLVAIVTDLEDDALYPAADLLSTYAARWTIEKVFHQITDVFSLKKLIGTAPKAALFQLSFCLLLYNSLAALRSYLAARQQLVCDRVSLEKLFDDARRQLMALHECLSVSRIGRLLEETRPAGDMRKYLARCLAPAWTKRWLKAKPQKRAPLPPKTRVPGNHTSTDRVLRGIKTNYNPARKLKKSP